MELAVRFYWEGFCLESVAMCRPGTCYAPRPSVLSCSQLRSGPFSRVMPAERLRFGEISVYVRTDSLLQQRAPVSCTITALSQGGCAIGVKAGRTMWEAFPGLGRECGTFRVAKVTESEREEEGVWLSARAKRCQNPGRKASSATLRTGNRWGISLKAKELEPS